MAYIRRFDCDLTDKNGNTGRLEDAEVTFGGIGDDYEAIAVIRGDLAEKGIHATNIEIHRN